MNWKRLNHRDCPVCGGIRNDCRQSELTQLVHCRYVEANPPDYIFRGTDILGFGLWGSKEGVEHWNEEKNRQWKEEQERIKQRKQ